MENGNFFLCQTSNPHPEFPPADGVVQIDLKRAITLRRVGPRCSSVEVVGSINMGGAIPSWVNTRITIPTMKSTSVSIQQYVRARGKGGARRC
jgi:hypothetical protein